MYNKIQRLFMFKRKLVLSLVLCSAISTACVGSDPIHDHLTKISTQNNQILEQGYQTKERVNDLNKEVTALKKYVRGSLLRRVLRNGTFFFCGVGAKVLYDNPELVQMYREKINNAALVLTSPSAIQQKAENAQNVQNNGQK